MKIISSLLLLLFIFTQQLSAQTVVGQRVADLMPQGYSIMGDALLEELDSGTLRLRLTEDYTTSAGPDVHILLNNSLSTAGAVDIVNLSAINQFSGAYSIDLPSNIDIDDYNFILLYCVDFQVFWASGEFGETTNPNGNFTCEDSETSAANGDELLSICPTDGEADVINFANNINTTASENYAFLLTDNNEVLQEVILDGSYDFEGSGSDIQRIYGIHYDGDLSPQIGANRLQTTASTCFTHSSGSNYLTITKMGCDAEFQCSESATATTNWVSDTTICPTDGLDDFIELRNSLFIAPGDHYAFLLTDENEMVQQVVTDTFYNFEGSGTDGQRVYGISYDGELQVAINANRMQTTATGCFTHSRSDLYLSIHKTACPSYECLESLTASHNWDTLRNICSTDGMPDEVFVQNNINVEAGENYVFLVTDANEILQEVLTDSIYNFEGSGTEEARIYGLSYDGELVPAIGEIRTNTTASNCFMHSGSNLFLRINKTAACATSTNNVTLAEQTVVYPNPAIDWVSIQAPASFQAKEVVVYNMLGRVEKQLTIESGTTIEFTVADLVAGNYILRLDNGEQFITKSIQVQP